MTNPAAPPVAEGGELAKRLERAAEMLRRYASVIRECHSSELERFDYIPEVEECAEVVDEAAAALSQPDEALPESAEPFCWYRVTRDITDEYVTVYSEHENCPGPDWKPLYAAPAPSAEAMAGLREAEKICKDRQRLRADCLEEIQERIAALGGKNPAAQELERSPNTVEKPFVMGRNGLNPLPAAAGPVNAEAGNQATETPAAIDRAPASAPAPNVDGRDFYELCQQYRHAEHNDWTVRCFNNLRDYIKTGKLPWPSYEEPQP